MAKKKVLIYISSHTNFSLLAALGEKLNHAKKSIHLICDSTDASLINKVETFSDNSDFSYYDFNEFLEQAKEEHLFNLLMPYIFKYKEYKNSQFHTFRKHHYKRLEASKLLLKKIKPNLILIAENGITGNYYLTTMAKRYRIPVLTCPYGHGGQRDLDNDLARKQYANELINCEGPIGKIILEKYSHWVKKGLFAGTLMYPPSFILALEKLKIRIPQPWTIQGGYTSKIAVESEAMLEHYKNEGIDEKKLALVGTIYCDLLHDEITNRPDLFLAHQNSAKIEKNKTSILVSWPPSYHTERGHLCDYETYETMVEKIFYFLNNLPCTQITVSLHPAVAPLHREMIAKLCNNVSNDYIINLIPRHDIFITSFSSTIRWAVAAGKPVVNYDFYRFKISDYSEAVGVKTMDMFQEFQDFLSKLVENNSLYEEIAQAQKNISSKWGMIDGNNFNRINSLIDGLI